MTVSRFFGAALISLSVLWLLLCGACTLYFVATGLDPHAASEVRGLGQAQAFFAVIVGVFCALPGVAVFFLGLFIRSRDKAQAVAEPVPAPPGDTPTPP